MAAPQPSLLRMSALLRLALVSLLVGAIWLAVFWATDAAIWPFSAGLP